MPAEKLAEKFGISIRTVYRDIKAIGESGIPVSFEAQKGYFIVPGYFLPPVSFTSEEANAMLLMESMVAGFADQSIRRHYSEALNKIKSVLRAPQKEKMEILHKHTRFQLPAGMASNAAHLSVLQEAIASRCLLEISYQKKDATQSRRLIEPIGLIYYAFSWHVIAWCHQRQDYRDFRVSRILNIHTTGEHFTRDQHGVLNTYMQSLPVDF